MTTALLVPVVRHEKILGLIDNIEAATQLPHALYWAATRGSQCERVLNDVHANVLADDGGTFPARINALFAATDEPYVFMGADDVRFHPGWLEAAMGMMEVVDGVVAVNDLFNPHGTLALVSRRYIDENDGTADGTGPVIHRGYIHNYSETELFNTAAHRGRFAYCAASVVEHLHWAAGKGEPDEWYRLGDRYAGQDQALHVSRSHLWGIGG